MQVGLADRLSFSGHLAEIATLAGRIGTFTDATLELSPSTATTIRTPILASRTPKNNVIGHNAFLVRRALSQASSAIDPDARGALLIDIG